MRCKCFYYNNKLQIMLLHKYVLKDFILARDEGIIGV